MEVTLNLCMITSSVDMQQNKRLVCPLALTILPSVLNPLMGLIAIS